MKQNSKKTKNTEKKVKKLWTAQENQELCDALAAHPENFKKVFEDFSATHDRTFMGTSAHWYATLSKDPQYTAVFMTVSRTKFGRNRRSMKDDIARDTVKTQSWWKRVIDAIFG